MCYFVLSSDVLLYVQFVHVILRWYVLFGFILCYFVLLSLKELNIYFNSSIYILQKINAKQRPNMIFMERDGILICYNVFSEKYFTWLARCIQEIV